MKKGLLFLFLLIFMAGCPGRSTNIDPGVEMFATSLPAGNLLILPPSMDFEPPGVKDVYRYGFTFMEGIRNGLQDYGIKAGTLSRVLTYSFYKNHLDRWEGEVVEKVYRYLRDKNLLTASRVETVPDGTFSYDFMKRLDALSRIPFIPLSERREMIIVDEILLVLKGYRLVAFTRLDCPYEIMKRYRVNFSVALLNIGGDVKGFVRGSYTGDRYSARKGDYLFARSIGKLVGKKLFGNSPGNVDR